MSKFKSLIRRLLPKNEQQEIVESVRALEKLLEFTEGLSPQERQSLPKVNTRNMIKVDGAMQVVIHAEDVLPGYVDPDEFKRTYSYFKFFQNLETAVGKVFERVSDSRMIYGNHLLKQSGFINRVHRDAIASGKPGMTTVFGPVHQSYAIGAGRGRGPEIEEEELNIEATVDEVLETETPVVPSESSSETPSAIAA